MLLVGVASAFGAVGHACATKCEKCEKEGKAYIERVQGHERSFETHRSQRYGHFSRQPHTLFASLAAATLSLVLIILDTDFMGLWLHSCSLSYLPFSWQTPSSFFLTPITIFAILKLRQ